MVKHIKAYDTDQFLFKMTRWDAQEPWWIDVSGWVRRKTRHAELQSPHSRARCAWLWGRRHTQRIEVDPRPLKYKNGSKKVWPMRHRRRTVSSWRQYTPDKGVKPMTGWKWCILLWVSVSHLFLWSDLMYEVMFCFESGYGIVIVDTELPCVSLAAASATLLPLISTWPGNQQKTILWCYQTIVKL